MPRSVLKEAQSRFSAAIDERIEVWFSRAADRGTFTGMMQYQLGYVDENLHPMSTAGGKRFRPLLALLACEAAGAPAERALDVAAAVELLHNFSLIHDDIQDRDESRRHRPTVWRLWGEAQGINVGDGMFALAGRAILASKDPLIASRLARRFQETALLLTEGQYLDMSFETRGDVTPEEYLAMIDRKTAVLIDFSVWAGAVVGGATEGDVQALSGFAHAFGMAYQIYDDMMGIWGHPGKTGKAPASDLSNRKKTLPVLLADRSDDVVGSYLAGAPVEVPRVIAALDRSGARGEAEARIHGFLDDAFKSLRGSLVDRETQETFVRLARELTDQDDATS